MLFYFVLRIYLSALWHKKPFKDSLPYRGFALFMTTPREDRKNIFRVLYEMEKLCWYWHTFPSCYFMFHMHLKDFQEFERMKTFVPQGFYSKYAGSTEYDILIDDKILFHDIMTMYELPVPKRYFTFRNNMFFIGKRVASEDEIDRIISDITDKRIFIKRYRGGEGKGIFVFSKREDGYYNDSNHKLSASYIMTNYKNVTLLFEKQIIQQSILSSFNPNTVNTLRVIVIKNKKNEFKIVGAAARFGRVKGYVDNGSQGGIMVGLDINTGTLVEYGSRLYDLKKYYTHPDSKLPFRSTEITEWDAVEKLVYTTMEYLHYYRAVAFDIVNTSEGPIIIEINTGAGIDAPQFGKEKGIAEEFL